MHVHACDFAFKSHARRVHVYDFMFLLLVLLPCVGTSCIKRRAKATGDKAHDEELFVPGGRSLRHAVRPAVHAEPIVHVPVRAGLETPPRHGAITPPHFVPPRPMGRDGTEFQPHRTGWGGLERTHNPLRDRSTFMSMGDGGTPAGLGLTEAEALQKKVLESTRSYSARAKPGNIVKVQQQQLPMVMEAHEVANSLWTESNLYETTAHAIVRCNCGVEDKPRFRLSYMPARNRGEILRLILEESGECYELEVVGFVPWRDTDIKTNTPHGKLPVLRNYDGQGNDLGQEGAITRFLADAAGLAGRTPAERAAVDSLYCLWWSTFRNNGVSHDGEHYSVAALKEVVAAGSQAIQSLRRPRYKDTFRVNDLSRAERSLMALSCFEEYLTDSKSGFLVGDSVTYVDLGLFYILFELAEADNVPDFAERFNLPQLGAFLSRMEKDPRRLAYLSNPRRMPRYARDTSGQSTYRFVPGKHSPQMMQ